MLTDLTLPLLAGQEDPGKRDISDRDKDLMRKGHYGTHLDRHLGPVPLEYFKSRALLFDVSSVCRERPILPADVPLELLQPGDFALFRTGALLRNPYGTREYLEDKLEFSWELIDSLLEKKVRFIGLDARGLRMGEEHREADVRCERSGAFVIENLANTEKLPARVGFTIYAASFDNGGSGIPCRVIAETNDMLR